MKSTIVLACLVLLQGAASSSPPADDDAAWQPYFDVAVLYAGPGGSREKAFTEFLEEWFDEVGVISLKDLSMDSAEGYDVVVADWMSQYGNDGYPEPEGIHPVPVELDDNFTRPVIAMNYVASGLRSGYKLDWL